MSNMEHFKNTLYSGPSGFRLKHLLGGEKSTNPVDWFHGSKVYFVHRGRTAIGIACELMNLRKDDEVLAPSYNCGAEIDPLIRSGVKVVLYKIDRSMKIDFEHLHRKISSKTRVLYITHYFGFPQPIVQIKQLCEEYGLYLIEDCALALFSRDGDIPLGSIGDISMFSLPKTLPVPDGGVISINNPYLANKTVVLDTIGTVSIFGSLIELQKVGLLRWLSEYPFLFQAFWPLYKRSRRMKQVFRIIYGHSEDGGALPSMPDEYSFHQTMRNKRVSSTTFRILEKFHPDKIIEKRRNNYKHYLQHLSGHQHITPLFKTLPFGVCPLAFPVIVQNRDNLCSTLRDHSVYAIKWWWGYHKELPWYEYPDACYLKDNVLTLPLHEDLGEQNVAYISNLLIRQVHSMSSQLMA